MNPRLAAQAVCEECASLASQGGNLYGSQSWPNHRTRRPQNGYLTRGLRERDLDLDFEGASRAADQPCGDRGGLERTLGNQWYIATHIKDVTP